jgi:hypothetical protein
MTSGWERHRFFIIHHQAANGLKSPRKQDIAMAERQNNDSESRRIIERVARETDPGGTSFMARTAKGARDHVTAADADQSDPIEYWGTRIGRALGLIVAIGLLIWLVLFVIQS